MIDPFSIITLISSYATGYKAGGMISEWMNGKNIGHFQNAFEYLTKGIDHKNTDFLKKSISEFDFINTEDDKLFVVAYSYLGRAVCYAYLLNFTLAYDYLEKLEHIEYGFFTRKKDTIEEIKNNGRSFRKEVEKLEDAYNEYLKSLQENDSDNIQETRINWKIILIPLLLILIIGLVFFIIF